MKLNDLVKTYIKEILITEEEIQKRVSELGEAITADYAGKDLVLVSVLRGGAFFLADLSRKIDLPVTIDFIAIASYGSSTKHTGIVRLVKDLEEPIEGKDVLIVEDIIDTGLTIQYLVRTLKTRKPATIEICTLLDKSVRRLVPLNLKYVGFEIPDVFVVGYGLDFDQKFRNIPFIGVLDIERLI